MGLLLLLINKTTKKLPGGTESDEKQAESGEETCEEATRWELYMVYTNGSSPDNVELGHKQKACGLTDLRCHRTEFGTVKGDENCVCGGGILQMGGASNLSKSLIPEVLVHEGNSKEAIKKQQLKGKKTHRDYSCGFDVWNCPNRGAWYTPWGFHWNPRRTTPSCTRTKNSAKDKRPPKKV